jgi:molecular chaperone GrpE
MQANDWSSTEDGTPATPAADAGDAPAQRIAELEAALLAVREEQLRERAELDNQRKRLARDVEQARKFANERVLGDLLPVIDSLQAGLAAGDTDAVKLREGLELTLRQLLKAAGDHGLEIVDPQGQPFDPERHQAMSLVDAADAASGSVVQVYQKGAVLHGRLIRPAMVVVAK